jgi:catechol 2,3-dioxygenase-like lactoylglutathione lyase family enzyme
VFGNVPRPAPGPVLGNAARRQVASYDAPVTDWDWSRIVFDHVKIGVRDAEASRRFYRTVLAALGISPLWEGEHGGQYANLVVSSKAAPGGPIHIGFVARSRAEVEAFHRAGLEAGYADNGAPGVREQYSSEAGGLYYAAFLLDPDGNNIEAVYRADFS